MALTSSRLAAAQALVALISTIQNPDTSLPLFQEVKLGAVMNPGDMTSWCEVLHFQGQGGPAGSGGNQIGWTIDDAVTYQVTSGIGPYETDTTVAETNMLMTQDILLPALRRHFELPLATNPTQSVQSVYSVLVSAADRSQVARFPGGHVYKLWHIFVLVKQRYSVDLQIP